MSLARLALSLSMAAPLVGTFGCDVEGGSVAQAPEADRGPLGKADATGSCRTEGADQCGGHSEAGNCWCDDFCVLDGSCCGDVQAVCPEVVDGPRVLVDDLDRPESVIVDSVTGTIFISNLAHGILDVDPLDPPEGRVGFISRHWLEGDMHTERFAEDFFSPKGMAIADRILYVADPFEVVAVDMETAQRVASYTVEDVGMFNDMATGPDGTVYVTDSANPALYRIDPHAPQGEALIEVARDPRFEFPNGVTVTGQTVYVATTGVLPSLTSKGTDGGLFAVRLDTGDVRELEGVSGRWDGVGVLDDGTVVVNDFIHGSVHAVDPDTGDFTKIMDSPAVKKRKHPAGIADLEVNGSTLMLPSMFTNELWIVAAAVSTAG